MFSVDSTLATGSLEHNDNLAIQGVSVACDSYTKQRLFPQNAFTDRFLGAFVKLRKATISFFTSVCLSVLSSVRMEQLGSHWTDFHEI